MDYDTFLDTKRNIGDNSGFEPITMPRFLFPFQQQLTEWAIRKGRAAIFADCGLGKTPMQLVWAQNVVEFTNKPVLILTPLSVGSQTVEEAMKFGISAMQSRDGSVNSKIVVTNYQNLHKFDSNQFAGVVCDESGILKNFKGQTKEAITRFMLKIQFRLLCTATAAPNDHVELGTSSEALGDLGYIEMLQRFFKPIEGGSYAQGGSGGGGMKRFNKEPYGSKYRFRGHAETDFWRWICSWARALRRPSDLGCDDAGYILPELKTFEHIVKARTKSDEWLFDMPAIGLSEQRKERSRTIEERCELAASLVANTGKPAVAWCHLNPEGELLEKLIPGAVNVEGSDDEDFKEEAFHAFAKGQIRVIVTKPTIAGFGLNWQHCAHQTFFPSHSFEQWYQGIRRCWRFGQLNPVRIDVIASEGEQGVLKNLNRKALQAEEMFAKLVKLMNQQLNIKRVNNHKNKQDIPSWL